MREKYGKEKLITLAEAANAFKYTSDHLAYLCRKGFIWSERHGRIWLTCGKAVEDYKEQAKAVIDRIQKRRGKNQNIDLAVVKHPENLPTAGIPGYLKAKSWHRHPLFAVQLAGFAIAFTALAVSAGPQNFNSSLGKVFATAQNGYILLSGFIRSSGVEIANLDRRVQSQIINSISPKYNAAPEKPSEGDSMAAGAADAKAGAVFYHRNPARFSLKLFIYNLQNDGKRIFLAGNPGFPGKVSGVATSLPGIYLGGRANLPSGSIVPAANYFVQQKREQTLVQSFEQGIESAEFLSRSRSEF